MPLMISRIGQARGRPVLFAAGKWGSITRHSLSVTSVWYRLALRLCFFRVVGVHMATPGLVSEPPGITSIPTTQPLSKRPLSHLPHYGAKFSVKPLRYSDLAPVPDLGSG